MSRLLKLGSDYVVYGLGPLYVVRADASTITFARDGGKSVRAEVANSGSVSGAWRYRGYGQVSASASLQLPAYFGLASELLDSGGLYYMRARWYDPGTARFLSRDPLGGDAVNPISLNAYPYAAANPLAFIDPTGLDPEGSDDWPDGPVCSPIPLPGKCTAAVQYSDDYVANLTVTIRPIGGLGVQIAFAKKAKKAKGSARKQHLESPVALPAPTISTGSPRRRRSYTDISSRTNSKTRRPGML